MPRRIPRPPFWSRHCASLGLGCVCGVCAQKQFHSRAHSILYLSLWPNPLLTLTEGTDGDWVCGLQGHCYRSRTGKLERWFNPSWIDESVIPRQPLDLPLIRVRCHAQRPPACCERRVTLRTMPCLRRHMILRGAAPTSGTSTLALWCWSSEKTAVGAGGPDGRVTLQEMLISSVLKRLMSDAPLGVLLSGGLDSSLVASIAVRCGLPGPLYTPSHATDLPCLPHLTPSSTFLS